MEKAVSNGTEKTAEIVNDAALEKIAGGVQPEIDERTAKYENMPETWENYCGRTKAS